MIRAEYAALLREQREDRPEWGGSAVRNAGDHIVRWLDKRKDIVSVLDFGCGLGTLGKHVKPRHSRLDLDWYEYDPSVPGKDIAPQRAYDAIVTTDVLEHIEPESLDETLTWIRDHAMRYQFHHIDCNDNATLLPDGRSVHLIVESMDWWQDKLAVAGWKVMYRSDIARRLRGRLRYSGTLILDRC